MGKSGLATGGEDVRRRMEAGGHKRLRVLGDGGEGNADPIGGHRKVHPAVQGGKLSLIHICKANDGWKSGGNCAGGGRDRLKSKTTKFVKLFLP